MSYAYTLDEYPEEQLRAELDRRERLQASGLCDYCGASPEHAGVQGVGQTRREGTVTPKWFDFLSVGCVGICVIVGIAVICVGVVLALAALM